LKNLVPQIAPRLRILPDLTPRQVYHRLRYRLLRQKRLPAFDDRHPCLFVLSTGRTGTKTLSALLRLAPNLFAHHEPRPNLFALSRLAYLHDQRPPAAEILAAAFAVARRELLDYALSCGRGYAETSPQVTFLAPAILRTVPDARFIHLPRPPADVVRSGLRRGWYAGHHRDSSRIRPRPGTEHAHRWQTYTVVQKNLWLWDETNRWILNFTASLPPQQCLRLKAEDLFAGRSAALQRLFAFASASAPPQKKIRAILNKKLNAQKKELPPLSPADRDAIQENLSPFTAQTAAALGYPLTAG